MFEFLDKNYNSITLFITLLAAITGLFCLKKYKGTVAVFFSKILVYLFLVELLGAYPRCYNIFEFLKPLKESILYYNRWWYTIFFDIIAVLLFSILFQKILKNNIHRVILNYMSIAYFLLAIILIVTNVDVLFKGSYPALYIFQAILIICCAVFFFMEIMQSEDILTFYKSLYFYISIAIFLWWFIVTPLIFYDQYFILEDKNFILMKRCIYIFSNIFMYSIFSIGLIVSKPEKTI